MQLHCGLAAGIGMGMPNGAAKRAVLQGKTGRIARPNGLFQTLKRAVSQVIVCQTVMKNGRDESI